MILGQFFSELPPESAAVEVGSWLRVLSGCRAEEILGAWEQYQADGPRAESGALRKPTPHDLRQKVMRQRAIDNPKPALPAPEREADQTERDGPRVTPEQAESILREVGFTPRRMAAIGRMPMARSLYGLGEADDDEARPAHWSDSAPADDARHRALEATRERNPLVRAAREAQARGGQQQTGVEQTGGAQADRAHEPGA